MHCHQLAKAVLSQLGHVFQVVLISLWPKESIVVIHFHLAAEILQRNSTIRLDFPHGECLQPGWRISIEVKQ